MGHIDPVVLVEVDSLLIITIFNNLPRGGLQTGDSGSNISLSEPDVFIAGIEKNVQYRSIATFNVVRPLEWVLFNKLTGAPRRAGIK